MNFDAESDHSRTFHGPSATNSATSQNHFREHPQPIPRASKTNSATSQDPQRPAKTTSTTTSTAIADASSIVHPELPTVFRISRKPFFVRAGAVSPPRLRLQHPFGHASSLSPAGWEQPPAVLAKGCSHTELFVEAAGSVRACRRTPHDGMAAGYPTKVMPGCLSEYGNLAASSLM